MAVGEPAEVASWGRPVSSEDTGSQPGPTKLVVTDLDGTLWRGSETHPETRQALACLKSLGVVVVGATARRRRSAQVALANHGLQLDAVVVNDGALGYGRLEDEPWRRCAFSDQTTRRLVEVLAEFGHEPMFETEHLEEGRDVIVGERPSIPADYFLTTPALRAELTSPLPQPAYAAVAIVERGIIASLSQTVLEAGLAAAWADYWTQFPETGTVRLRPLACTKWAAIEAYCSQLGVQPSEVMAVGDNDNDLEMITLAGVGVAVASGSEGACAAATHIVSAPDDGGWAEIMSLVRTS